MLYQLPQAIGNFPAGTILLATNSANATHVPEEVIYTTQLDLYASRDAGVTWTFVSHITSRAGGYVSAFPYK
jgi:hypothetical protein